MESHGADLTGMTVVALAALVFGIALERLRQPALVGYILAGVALGPVGLGLVDEESVSNLAELGVLLLLFVVGMELSLRAFRRLWRLFLTVTLFQVLGSTGVMIAATDWAGLPVKMGLFLGFAVALSSTAVAVKILEDLGELRSRIGRITVGVLIAQDLAVVPMMLVLSALAGEHFDWMALPKILFSVLFLVFLILFLSRGRKVSLPLAQVVGNHRDLTPLAALAFCLGAATISGLAGLSAAYGAFLAGLIIGNSHQRQAMLQVIEPFQSVMMMVFFLSIGLLIDLHYLWNNLGIVLLLLIMVAVFKTVLNVGILRLLGEPWARAFLVGVLIAQIGEFSFLLTVVGVKSGLISAEDRRLIVSVTALSLALSPLWVFTARRLRYLAEDGITSGRQILRLVYAPEAEFVAETFGDARLRTKRVVRKVALLLRRRRLRRLRRKQALLPIAALVDMPRSSVEEVVPSTPATPSNDDGRPLPGPAARPRKARTASGKGKGLKKRVAERGENGGGA